MRRAINLAALFLIVSLFTSPAYSVVLDQVEKEEPAYAANQIIVQFRKGESPDELKAMVEAREVEKKSFLGLIKIFFQDLKIKFQGQETPEEKLSRLQETERKAGVISTQKLFSNKDDASLSGIYLLTLDGEVSVLEAVDLYKDLPEVSSAEPNYIQRIQKMGI